jgi:hypothetical protein
MPNLKPRAPKIARQMRQLRLAMGFEMLDVGVGVDETSGCSIVNSHAQPMRVTCLTRRAQRQTWLAR